MNYYAELGVRHDASDREIRQAYRVLVRLLHPDSQSGEDLRLAAERQLSRLNAILAVLTNADARRAYDRSLDLEWPRRNSIVLSSSTLRRKKPPQSVFAMAGGASRVARLALKYWAVVLIGVVIFGAATLSSLLHGNGEAVEVLRTTDVQPKSHAPAAARKRMVSKIVSPANPSNEVVEKQPAPELPPAPRLKSAPGIQKLPLRAALPAEGAPSDPSGTQSGGSNQASTTNAWERVTQEQPTARPSPAQVLAFSGNWFYTTDLSATQQTEGYRALYVELLLSETQGTLSGSYRARYVVPDKAISPQVAFHLQGRADSERKARAEWTSAGGARGEAELSLSSPGVMEFRWWSTQLGSQTGLSSGTARLVRQRTP